MKEVTIKIAKRDWLIIISLIAIAVVTFAYLQVYFSNDFYPICTSTGAKVPCILYNASQITTSQKSLDALAQISTTSITTTTTSIKTTTSTSSSSTTIIIFPNITDYNNSNRYVQESIPINNNNRLITYQNSLPNMIWNINQSFSGGGIVPMALDDAYDTYINCTSNIPITVTIISPRGNSVYALTSNSESFWWTGSEGCAGYEAIFTNISQQSFEIYPHVEVKYNPTPYLSSACNVS